MGSPAENEALAAGLVSVTTGGMLGALTVMLTAPEVVAAPWSSVAFAVIEKVPAGAFPQAKLYGVLVSSPSFAVPLKNSTFTIDPLVSLAFAVMVIVAPLLKV